MMLLVARKELAEIFRDGRFLWTSAIVALLLVIAIGGGAQRYSEDRNMRVVAQQEDREGWLNQGEKGPHSAGHYGVYAFKPSTPLALFDPGYNDYTGTLQYLEAHKENQPSFKPAADATALQRFGNLSGAMVMQLLVPLLIILLSFAMVSGERESGTLRQLMTNGAPLKKVIWGKALGVATAASIVLLPSILLGGVLAAAVAGDNDPHDMIDFGPKLGLLALCYVSFFATFIFVSLGVSIRARSSSGALTILIAFWIVSALLLPRVGVDISKRLYPTPSVFEVNAAIQEGRAQGPRAHEPNHPNHIAFRTKVLKEYGVEKVEDLPVNFIGLALQADEELGFEVFDRTFGEIRNSFAKQDAVQLRLSILSPFIAIKSVSSGFSGTDVAFFNDFSAAGEAYRRNMVRILNEDLMKNAQGMTNYSSEWGYRANADLWSRVPAFDFDAPGLSTIVNRNSISLLILLGWLIASIIFLSQSARSAKVES